MPTQAFIATSWVAWLIGSGAYLFGIVHTNIVDTAKLILFCLMLLGLLVCIWLQKIIRDKVEHIANHNFSIPIAWACLITIVFAELFCLKTLPISTIEKAFFVMAFSLSMFSAVSIQKNNRDKKLLA